MYRPENNPLLNHLVIQEVFRHCDSDSDHNYSHLKALRLVSPIWDSILFRPLEKRTLLRVPRPCPETLSEAFDFGRIYRSIQFLFPRELESPNMGQWMEDYGHCLEYIKLTDSPPNFKNKSQLTQYRNALDTSAYLIPPSVLQQILSTAWCPNLKTLEIPTPVPYPAPPQLTEEPKVVCLTKVVIGSSVPWYTLRGVEQVASHVFSLCKEVHHVTLIRDTYQVRLSHPHVHVAVSLHFPNVFQNWEQWDSFQTLESLDLGIYTLPLSAVGSLSQMRLPQFRRLKIGFIMSHWMPQELSNWLFESLNGENSQLNSLELVKKTAWMQVVTGNQEEDWGRRYDSSKFYSGRFSSFQFTTLQTLTEHSGLRVLCLDLSQWKLDNLNFLLNFQQLRELTLMSKGNYYVMMTSTRHLFRVGRTQASLLRRHPLLSLEVLNLHFEVDVDVVEAVLVCFPNLKKFGALLPISLHPTLNGLSQLVNLETLEFWVPWGMKWFWKLSLPWNLDISNFRTLKHLQISNEESCHWRDANYVGELNPLHPANFNQALVIAEDGGDPNLNRTWSRISGAFCLVSNMMMGLMCRHMDAFMLYIRQATQLQTLELTGLKMQIDDVEIMRKEMKNGPCGLRMNQCTIVG